MPMISIKLKRNDDGTRTLDPSDPMAALAMAALKGDALGQINNLLNPKETEVPEIKDEAGMTGYQMPGMQDEETPTRGVVNSPRPMDSPEGRIIGVGEEKHMRRMALEFATKTHSGQTSKMVLDTAQAYYDFLAGNAMTPPTIAAPDENG